MKEGLPPDITGLVMSLPDAVIQETIAEAAKNGKGDIYRAIAARVTEVPYEEVSGLHRSQAKQGLFGYLYGSRKNLADLMKKEG
jgi:DNA polymerase I-like protein with 3'-5' exonuclease and polymerase domains